MGYYYKYVFYNLILVAPLSFQVKTKLNHIHFSRPSNFIIFTKSTLFSKFKSNARYYRKQRRYKKDDKSYPSTLGGSSTPDLPTANRGRPPSETRGFGAFPAISQVLATPKIWPPGILAKPSYSRLSRLTLNFRGLLLTAQLLQKLPSLGANRLAGPTAKVGDGQTPVVLSLWHKDCSFYDCK